jgi:hypothetical protein
MEDDHAGAGIGRDGRIKERHESGIEGKRIMEMRNADSRNVDLLSQMARLFSSHLNLV